MKNASVAEIREKESSIASKTEGPELDKKVEVLAPGESIVICHDQSDSKVIIEYAFAGTPFKHIDGYVDLWKGQTWLVTIQGDGEPDSTWR